MAEKTARLFADQNLLLVSSDMNKIFLLLETMQLSLIVCLAAVNVNFHISMQLIQYSAVTG